MPDLREVFAKELRLGRKRAGLTQADLAERAELSIDMVGRLERAMVSPSLETVDQLSQALGLAPHVLLGGPAGEHPGDRATRQVLRRLRGLDQAEIAWIDRVVESVLSGRRGDR